MANTEVIYMKIMRCKNPKSYLKLLNSSPTNRNKIIDNNLSLDKLVHHFEKLGNIPAKEILPDTCSLHVNGDGIINDVVNKETSIDKVQGCIGRLKKTCGADMFLHKSLKLLLQK